MPLHSSGQNVRAVPLAAVGRPSVRMGEWNLLTTGGIVNSTRIPWIVWPGG